MRGVIRIGDTTTHGGRVISATSRMVIDGLPVARVGDSCSCPMHGHGNCTIVEGRSDFMVDGIPVAFEGNKTSCGATLRCSTNISTIASTTAAPHPSPMDQGQPHPMGSVVEKKALVAEENRPQATPLSAQDVRAAYKKAYEEWWETRPSKFRTWGPFSNAIGWWLKKNRPVCVDYAEAAAEYMNVKVSIPGTGAYAMWDTEKATDTLGKFEKTAPSGSHCKIHVFLTTAHGNVQSVGSFDPWWRF